MLKKVVAIQDIPLPSLLKQYEMDPATYISVDCEGCEVEFIRTFNFTEFDVQWLNYENNSGTR